MAISDKITSIQNHLKDDWDSVESLIGDTELDKNIENISSALDDLYNDLPKVTGSGTSITLDDTRKGRLESTLNGNTSQFTTTGKNFYSTSMLPITQYGITISKNANGDIVLNGTPNYNEGFKTFYTGDVITVEAGTYTLSVANKVAGIGCVVGGFNGGCNLTLTDTVTSKSAYADTPQNVNPAINIRYDVGTLTNFVLNPQMEKSTSATTYEPFTNGASPNPDYPQDIHVVSGDNKITVCSKNLFDKSKESEKYLINSAGTLTPNNDYNSSDFINIKSSTSIVLSTNTTSAILEIVEYDKNKSLINRGVKTNSNFYTLTTNVNTKYVRISYQNTSTQTQLEYGSSSTTYEPCSSNTYNINLPVENLLQLPDGSKTTNGITATITNGKLKIVGTTTTNWFSICNLNIPLESGTYLFSYTNKECNRYNFNIKYADNTTQVIYGNTYSNTLITLNQKATITGMFSDNNTTGATFDYEDYLMIEKGSKANSYTPYGITPIELGKTSTYKDKLIRTSGKNLFDKNTITSGYRLDGSGIPNGSASNEFTSDFIEVESGKTYIRNYGSVSAYTRTCFYDKNKSFVSKNDDSQSITIPDNVKYIRFSEYLSRLDTMQLEKGSSATDFEPYGSGEWYYKEAIKKVVLDGTETISAFDATSLSGSYQATFGITARATTTDKVAISDKFISALLSDRTTKTNIVYSYSDGYLRIATNVANTMAGFKTWLGTNNPKVLLEAATPTYTKITYEPLLKQLEAYYHAKSRATQTNISQENNDLPFEIDASALKEWSV